jgi:hypothetical protein
MQWTELQNIKGGSILEIKQPEDWNEQTLSSEANRQAVNTVRTSSSLHANVTVHISLVLKNLTFLIHMHIFIQN